VIALAAGATFIARSFSGDPKHMAGVIAEGVRHRGYALIDVLQPCVTFNRVNTYAWYRERIYRLEEEEGYDPSDRTAAWHKAQEWGERIPVGVIYQVEGVPVYEDQVKALEGGSPVSRLPELARAPTLEQYERLKEQFV
jgi:2-oxoglutarate ferredoxin oxidoreductase subunit beta